MFQQGKRVLGGLVALGALALGGSAIADAASSTGSSTTSSTAQTAPSGSGSQAPAGFSGPAHGTAAHEDAEKPVTGAAAAKAQAAAVKAVGGGTAGPVTTDLTGSGFETTVTKSDGSTVEVHLDSSYQAFQGPGGHGGPGGQGAAGGQGAPGSFGG